MNWQAENKYADIINLPHHVSRNHPQMSMADRAAQFSPFAALTGHDAAIAQGQPALFVPLFPRTSKLWVANKFVPC